MRYRTTLSMITSSIPSTLLPLTLPTLLARPPSHSPRRWSQLHFAASAPRTCIHPRGASLLMEVLSALSLSCFPLAWPCVRHILSNSTPSGLVPPSAIFHDHAPATPVFPVDDVSYSFGCTVTMLFSPLLVCLLSYFMLGS